MSSLVKRSVQCIYSLCVDRPKSVPCCGLQQVMNQCKMGELNIEEKRKGKIVFLCWPEGKIICKCPLKQALKDRNQSAIEIKPN